MIAWAALGLLAVLMMTMELIPINRRVHRVITVAGLMLIMVGFSGGSSLPAEYQRLLGALPNRVIDQEGVLATTLGLTAIWPVESSPRSLTLLIWAAVGGVVAVSANNWLLIFLGIETVNIGVYGLLGDGSRDLGGDEALLKFFILTTVFTALAILGMGLVGGAQGTLEVLTSVGTRPGLAAGESLLLAVLLFKLGSFPFHWWAPDTYEGTPWEVATVIATLPKFVAGALLIRLAASHAFGAIGQLSTVFDIVAVGTMVVGALGAWRQPRLKRMLAYAAISQVGFILLPLARGQAAAAFAYLATYVLASLQVFSAAHALAGSHNPRREELVGAWHPPTRGPAGALVIALAAFAGFPFTLGMAAKLYSVESVLAGPMVVWLIALLVTGFTFLYYFRWIYPIFAPASPCPRPKPRRGLAAMSQVSAVFLVLLGLWTYPLLWLMHALGPLG